ncbi:MAG TPA: multicopper oxidase domain-containing protein, partial [Polyangiaceae bacterium]|nr:multicopper oxidase domain-containing protein [Polyangiaceae bacterium]
LALPGYELIQLGTDGGFIEQPQTLDELLLVPGERADIAVVAKDGAMDPLDWETLPYDRGHGTGDLPAASVFELRPIGDTPIETPLLPDEFLSIPPLGAATVMRELKLDESMMGAHGGHGSAMGPVFSINGHVYPDGERFLANLGDVEEWSVVNTTEMDHPFHLHGFRFQVVSNDGVPPPYLAWHDTVNVPANETVKLRLHLEDHPGTWMFHCHILEHAERGMMGELEVRGAE